MMRNSYLNDNGRVGVWNRPWMHLRRFRFGINVIENLNEEGRQVGVRLTQRNENEYRKGTERCGWLVNVCGTLN